MLAEMQESLVLVPRSVLLLAQLAVCRGLRVVYSMLRRRKGLQIRKHRFQVIVCQILEFAERHDKVTTFTG